MLFSMKIAVLMILSPIFIIFHFKHALIPSGVRAVCPLLKWVKSHAKLEDTIPYFFLLCSALHVPNNISLIFYATKCGKWKLNITETICCLGPGYYLKLVMILVTFKVKLDYARLLRT
jgi:hypothetical protein